MLHTGNTCIARKISTFRAVPSGEVSSTAVALVLALRLLDAGAVVAAGVDGCAGVAPVAEAPFEAGEAAAVEEGVVADAGAVVLARLAVALVGGMQLAIGPGVSRWAGAVVASGRGRARMTGPSVQTRHRVAVALLRFASWPGPARRAAAKAAGGCRGIGEAVQALPVAAALDGGALILSCRASSALHIHSWELGS